MPFMTGSPVLLPLALRPANASNGSNSHGSMPIVEEETRMDFGNTNKSSDSQLDPTQERIQRLIVKNRRKRYLEMHPEYFSDYSLELADPLLYDRLIRRFQTASEREDEGRRKGFSGQMATDLWRAEAKKDALRQPDPHSLFTYSRGPQGQIIAEDKDEIPMTKEEGKAWWIDEMTQRFLRGGDDDFDYKITDGNVKYDDPEEERDLQDAWFDSMESDFDSDGEGREKILIGETGIQDY